MVIQALRSLEWSQVVGNYFEENKNSDLITLHTYQVFCWEINDFIFSIQPYFFHKFKLCSKLIFCVAKFEQKCEWLAPTWILSARAARYWCSRTDSPPSFSPLGGQSCQFLLGCQSPWSSRSPALQSLDKECFSLQTILQPLNLPGEAILVGTPALNMQN